MDKIFELFKRIFTSFGNEKQFVYNFDIYDGTEETLNIYDTNVVEYEFVNLGTTVCVINDMPLYPVASGKQWHHWKPIIGFNEMDVSIYKYKFTGPPDFFQTSVFVYKVEPHELDYAQPFEGAGVDRGRAYASELYNRLLVISKVKADKKTSKSS